MAAINNSATMVFHSVGDTGGVNTPTQIENVAAYMEKDFAGSDLTAYPSFFYHLGDVVYYDGETPNYFPEFYEPYMNYPAPIFAIPGNHDGDVNEQFPEPSLAAFVRNFCSQVPVITPAKDAPRHAMTQPVCKSQPLQTPLATIIGLYSNCPEGGELSQAQIDWFQSELENAPILASKPCEPPVTIPIILHNGPNAATSIFRYDFGKILQPKQRTTAGLT